MKSKVCMLMALLAIFTCVNAKSVKGNGQIVTRSYNVENYDKINIAFGSNSGFFNFNFRSDNKTTPKFYYAQSNAVSLKITTDRNLFEYIEVFCKNGQLTIKNEKNVSISTTRLEVSGSSKGLSYVDVSGNVNFIATTPLNGNALKCVITGSGDIALNGAVKATNFEASITGSGDIKAVKGMQCNGFNSHISGSGDMNFAGVSANSVEASITGSGDIALSGRANQGHYSTSGSGDINASGLMVKNAECHSSGSGDISVYATDTLNSGTSGSGDIRYKGSPKIDSHNSGSSSLTRIRE